MQHPIRSLHHVTATVDDAQQDLDFSRGALGLRLVKQTVNFDNHNVFHFYYGDAIGRPGTIWTTFPYRGWNVPVGTQGAGQVTGTAFSVPAGSLGFWRERLTGGGYHVLDTGVRFGEDAIAATDPSGLVIELVATERDSRSPWLDGRIGPPHAIRGLHSVTLTVREEAPTVTLFTDLLGFRVVDREPGRTRVGLGDHGPGNLIDIVADREAPAARNGLGTVHHVALAISDAEEQVRLREELLRRGCQVTDVRDRCYFQSIYFREPGGVLLEVATVQPGFTVDEDAAYLGQSLKLPAWEEPNRAAIEAGLPRIRLA